MKRSIVIASITTADKQVFNSQLNEYLKFTDSIHIDFADGSITPNKLLSLNEISWPPNSKIFLHIMAADPFLYLNQIVKLSPHRVIFPFDIGFDNPLFATKLREAGIESGIYLDSAEQLEDAKWQLAHFQEVMIFAGSLGYQGAEANLDLLALGPELKKAAPFIDLGWDGGVSDSNISKIKQAGFNNIVSGGFISSSSDSEQAYSKLALML
jgi:pentose-5-phosphate-3-epimerase